jgi:endonuclease YncB( thermonuclease family)
MPGALFLSAFLFTSSSQAAVPLEGRVVHVVDGDTLDVLVRGDRVRVRLVEIDAPEKGQPYTNASRQSLIATCGGQFARIEATGKDRNGRTLAREAASRRSAADVRVHIVNC